MQLTKGDDSQTRSWEICRILNFIPRLSCRCDCGIYFHTAPNLFYQFAWAQPTVGTVTYTWIKYLGDVTLQPGPYHRVHCDISLHLSPMWCDSTMMTLKYSAHVWGCYYSTRKKSARVLGLSCRSPVNHWDSDLQTCTQLTSVYSHIWCWDQCEIANLISGHSCRCDCDIYLCPAHEIW